MLSKAMLVQYYNQCKPFARFFGWYYIVNILLLLSYPLTKHLVYTYKGHFASNALPSWERQALSTFMVVTVIKFFRASTMDAFFSDFFMYGKSALSVLLYMINRWVFVSYMVAYVALFVLVPQPKYDGPEELLELTPGSFDQIILSKRRKGRQQQDEPDAGTDKIQEDMDEDSCRWLVLFYTAWSPPCSHISPLFSSLSIHYNCSLLRFARLDVGRWPRVASDKRFDINISVNGNSKQLPTLIMYNSRGAEIGRVPHVYSDGRIARGRFRRNDIITAFQLDAIFVKSAARTYRQRQEHRDDKGKKSLQEVSKKEQ